jgi:hypothetical protein
MEDELHLLDVRVREAIEPFLKRKMEESKQRILVNWDPEE